MKDRCFSLFLVRTVYQYSKYIDSCLIGTFLLSSVIPSPLNPCILQKYDVSKIFSSPVLLEKEEWFHPGLCRPSVLLVSYKNTL